MRTGSAVISLDIDDEIDILVVESSDLDDNEKKGDRQISPDKCLFTAASV